MLFKLAEELRIPWPLTCNSELGVRPNDFLVSGLESVPLLSHPKPKI